jgi:hypothetical protein
VFSAPIAAAAARALTSISGVMSMPVTLPCGPTICEATSESVPELFQYYGAARADEAEVGRHLLWPATERGELEPRVHPRHRSCHA